MPPLKEFASYPKHLHDGKGPARIVHNAVEEKEAREAGYGDAYIPQHDPPPLPADPEAEPEQATGRRRRKAVE